MGTIPTIRAVNARPHVDRDASEILIEARLEDVTLTVEFHFSADGVAILAHNPYTDEDYLLDLPLHPTLGEPSILR